MKTDVDKIEENSNDMKVIHQSEEKFLGTLSRRYW